MLRQLLRLLSGVCWHFDGNLPTSQWEERLAGADD